MASLFLLLFVLIPTLLMSVARTGGDENAQSSASASSAATKLKQYDYEYPSKEKYRSLEDQYDSQEDQYSLEDQYGSQERYKIYDYYLPPPKPDVCEWTPEGWQRWYDLYQDNDLIKDLSENIVPDTRLKIIYGKTEYEPGAEIPITEVVFPPRIEWCCDKNQYYTLFMLDAAPLGASKGRTYVHWRVDNIANCDLKQGHTTGIYSNPKPVAGGIHRYLFLMFPHKASSSEVSSLLHGSTGRIEFSVNLFMEEYGLKYPYAGSFFKAGFTNFTPVPEVAKKLPLAAETDEVQKIQSVPLLSVV